MGKFNSGHLIRNTGRIMKGAAALVAAAAFVVASMTMPPPDTSVINDEVLNAPAPVVMTIDEAADVITEESPAEEEKIKKMGFFTKLKLGFYSLCAAFSAWFAHKIPWKKIFNKRNLYILLAIICLGLAAHFLLPLAWEEYPF